MIKDFFKLAYSNLLRRKIRAWLTVLGIIISVTIVFILISLSLGLEASVQEQFRILGADKFFIQPKGQIAGPGSSGAISLTEEDLDTIERVSGVKATTYYTITTSKIEYRDEIRFVTAAAVDIENQELFFETSTAKLAQGRFLTSNNLDKVILGAQYSGTQFLRNGVELGDKIMINDAPFEVVGIMTPVGNPSDDRLIYMHEESFENLFNITDRLDSIVVQIDEGRDINEIAERVGDRLANEREVDDDNRDFTILTPEELLKTIGNVLNIIGGFLIGVSAISLLVGSIGIMNTMYTAVLERTKEIGIMKAVGAGRKEILLVFLIEAGLIGLIGGIIGVTFGAIIVKGVEYVIANMLGIGFFKASIPLTLVLGSMIFSFLIGAISGTFPAMQASKLKPVDALRYE